MATARRLIIGTLSCALRYHISSRVAVVQCVCGPPLAALKIRMERRSSFMWKRLMKTKSAAGIGMACVVLMFVTACAARTDSSRTGAGGTRDQIVVSELTGVGAIDAYGVVQQLRPQWLRSRGPASLRDSRGTLPTVYVDNMRFGDLVTLQNIPIDEIAEIRYINGPDATIRWGTGVVGGVIEVIRKR